MNKRLIQMFEEENSRNINMYFVSIWMLTHFQMGNNNRNKNKIVIIFFFHIDVKHLFGISRDL